MPKRDEAGAAGGTATQSPGAFARLSRQITNLIGPMTRERAFRVCVDA